MDRVQDMPLGKEDDTVEAWVRRLGAPEYRAASARLLVIGEPALQYLARIARGGGGIPGAALDARDDSDRLNEALLALAEAHRARFFELVEAEGLDSSQLVWILGQIDDERVAPLLLRALTQPNSTVREHASRFLIARGSPALAGELTAALRDRSSQVRLNAVKALARFGAPAQIPALRKAAAAKQNHAFQQITDAIEDAILAIEARSNASNSPPPRHGSG